MSTSGVYNVALSNKPAWGSNSLRLHLPGSDILLLGLSARQREALVKNYPGFVNRQISKNDEETTLVYTYRLERPLSIPSEEMTYNKQYSPQKIRGKEGVTLTGINFTSQIDSRSKHQPLSLGVANEHELTLSNVIENFLRVYSAYQALELGGVLLHSAGLVFDDSAYIFVGRSGVGKTTLTRKAHRHGVKILSDDINVLLPQNDGYAAYAVPFTGEFGCMTHQKHEPASYNTAAVCLFEQANELAVSAVNQSASVARLYSGCPFVNADEFKYKALLDNLATLARRVPLLRLQARRDDSIQQIMTQVCDGLN